MAEVDVPEASLRNLVAQKSLQWIFVGGKGGVGKTTTSCCLAIQLAAQREKVLIVSTDPAHNLSDAFGQKFTREPTPVNGFSNLAVMEIDPNVDLEEMNADGVQDNSGMASFMKDLTNSIPGIDEAMSFAELMKQVQNMDYSVIVFDTAPTGHTLRLLSFPTALDKAFDKILSLKNQFSGMFSQVSALLGGALPSQEMLLGKLEQTREVIQKVNAQFKDPERTTFVCVCIPEFLSLYETERLVQELTKYEIDVHNVVVNQVLYPEEGSECKSCSARQKMQQKYIDQIYDLYEDFHVVEMPLLTEEVRGVPSLKAFSENLLAPYEPNQ
ncbi:Arsenite-Antimonite Effluxprotein [Phytophthora megakarya]|uniref:ATPase ASNA1 homolog n=1 Tax=Phytophthora megakarya TaxID=4795 RepID=A0A225VPL4_9STRA|nr:Arsenite-Antimonite Effluxprotein [Phytophthora megakarya]